MRFKIFIGLAVYSSFCFGGDYAFQNTLTDVEKGNIKHKRIVINLEKQELTAYNKGGKFFMKTIISTGRFGHATPVGYFTVLQKEQMHKSTLYPRHKNGTRGGAKMPWMLRVTWDGVAIHQGVVPRVDGQAYPNSHGCIRVPRGNAKKLYKWADRRTQIDIGGTVDYNKDRVNRARIMMSASGNNRYGTVSKKKRKAKKQLTLKDNYIGGMDFADDNTKGLSYREGDLDYLDNL